MLNRPRTLACLVLALLAAPQRANGARHDLPDNRATLVLRDGRHVSLTLYINYADALRRALSPDQALGEFLVAASAMPPKEFGAALRRAEEAFRSALRLEQPDGTRLALDHWMWPNAAQVQASLQRQAAATIIDPMDHAHEPPVEIRADAVAPAAVGALRVRFPAAFQRVMLVWYSARQTWAEPARATRIVF